MSVEQVARDFITNMQDVQKVKSYLAPGATVDGGILPQPVPATQAVDIINKLDQAFSDLHFDIKSVSVNGNKATVHATWGGTQSQPLRLDVPGMQGLPNTGLPPTGKHVSVADTYIVTVEGDKVTHLTVDSPPDGGIPGALRQLGINLPG